MWRPWAKPSNPRIHNTSSFSCSSFKDIESLFPEQNHQQPTATESASATPTSTVVLRRSPSVFHRVRLASALIRNWPSRRPEPDPYDHPPLPRRAGPPLPKISLPGTERRIIVYYTSLRAVRSTFKHCKDVLTVLRAFRVKVDERDLVMDSNFLRELQAIFGRNSKHHLNLPIVFIGGRYVGGAEEIWQLHESGELRKIVQGFPVATQGVCDTCGGYKFILCTECNGGHKLYSSPREGAVGFRICNECNENGLIRCPSCSSSHNMIDIPTN